MGRLAAAGVVCAVVAAVAIAVSRSQRNGKRTVPIWTPTAEWAVASVAVLVVLAGGRSFVEEKALGDRKASMAPFFYGEVDAMGEVASEPKRTLGAERFVVRLSALASQGTTQPTSARVLVTAPRSSRPPLGATVYVSGVIAPLRPPTAAYYERSHVVAVVRARFVEIRAPPRRLVSAGDWVRERLAVAVSSALPKTEGALMLGLLIGDDADLEQEIKDAFREAGMSHLTAVSGQNFAIVLGIAASAIDALKRRRKRPEDGGGHNWARTATLVAVALFFGLLTRWEPSVLRAGTMAVLGLCWATAGGRIRSVDVLSMSVAVLVVIDPFLLDLVGFQLSVAATAGILVSGLRWARSWRDGARRALGRGPAGPLVGRVAGASAAVAAVSLAAQVYVAPVLFWRFGTLQSAGAISNLLAVPLAAITSLFGFLAAVPAVIFPRPAAGLYVMASPALSLLVDTAEAFSSFPHPEVTMTETQRGVVAASVCLSVVLVFRLFFRGRARPGPNTG